ncbi:MAG: preprotein translocase subunit SecG [Bacteroidetes bacterium]|nr:preprotein translocase subunit SecG [Bacteroidota bacterium]
MFAFLVVIIAIIAVLLTLVVLLQSGKGGGLAGIASGGATTQILGSRQAPDFLEKATWTLASAFIVLCILSNFVIGPEQGAGSVIQQQSQSGEVEAPVLSLPTEGTTPATDGTTTPAAPAETTPQ